MRVIGGAKRHRRNRTPAREADAWGRDPPSRGRIADRRRPRTRVLPLRTELPPVSTWAGRLIPQSCKATAGSCRGFGSPGREIRKARGNAPEVGGRARTRTVMSGKCPRRAREAAPVGRTPPSDLTGPGIESRPPLPQPKAPWTPRSGATRPSPPCRTMTPSSRSPEPSPPDEGDLVPASLPAKLLLTAAPFALAALVYLALRWLV